MTFSDREEDEAVLNEINVVPLVDIMLVLLVLFIVTASVATTRIEVNLPRADAEAEPDEQSPIVISIDRHGDYRLDGTSIRPQELREQLLTLHEQHPDRGVQLQADREVPFDRVGKAMAMIQAGGIDRIAVLTMP